MFWLGDGNPTSADKIRSSRLDGSDENVLHSGLDSPNRLTLYRDGGSLFWTEGGFSFGSVIRSSSVDGTGLTDVVSEQVGGSVALDETAAKLYWSDRRIKRASLDGSNVEELHSATFTVDWLTIDPLGGKMYWLTEDRIERANLDGSGLEVVASGLGRPGNLTILASTATAIDGDTPVTGEGYLLEPAYPNPFRSRTTAGLIVDRPQHVRVELYDAIGRLVATPHDGWLPAAVRQRISLDATHLPAGTYVYRVTGDDFRTSGRAVVIR